MCTSGVDTSNDHQNFRLQRQTQLPPEVNFRWRPWTSHTTQHGARPQTPCWDSNLTAVSALEPPAIGNDMLGQSKFNTCAVWKRNWTKRTVKGWFVGRMPILHPYKIWPISCTGKASPAYALRPLAPEPWFVEPLLFIFPVTFANQIMQRVTLQHIVWSASLVHAPAWTCTWKKVWSLTRAHTTTPRNDTRQAMLQSGVLQKWSWRAIIVIFTLPRYAKSSLFITWELEQMLSHHQKNNIKCLPLTLKSLHMKSKLRNCKRKFCELAGTVNGQWTPRQYKYVPLTFGNAFVAMKRNGHGLRLGLLFKKTHWVALAEVLLKNTIPELGPVPVGVLHQPPCLGLHYVFEDNMGFQNRPLYIYHFLLLHTLLRNPNLFLLLIFLSNSKSGRPSPPWFFAMLTEMPFVNHRDANIGYRTLQVYLKQTWMRIQVFVLSDFWFCIFANCFTCFYVFFYFFYSCGKLILNL